METVNTEQATEHSATLGNLRNPQTFGEFIVASGVVRVGGESAAWEADNLVTNCGD